MLRIAFGSILLISGLSGRLALVGESASQSIALGGAMLTMFGVLSMLAKRAKAESAAESVKTLSGA